MEGSKCPLSLNLNVLNLIGSWDEKTDDRQIEVDRRDL
jgi:hypothetical protein